MDHPFGHGRIEYIAGLCVSGIIVVVAFELFRDSVDKLMHPEGTTFGTFQIVILGISILVKLYMFYYNFSLSKRFSSPVMRATAIDSISDVVATGVVLLCLFINLHSGINFDGVAGVFVSVFIGYAGVSAAKETIDPLLGQPPTQAFIDEVSRIVLSFDQIEGMHDLVVHDYGPGRRMISLHAEVPADGNLVSLHEQVDEAERELEERLHVNAVIHMDPTDGKNPETVRAKEIMDQLLREMDEQLSMHDFRLTDKNGVKQICFDVVVPYRFGMSDGELRATLTQKGQEHLGADSRFRITIDKPSVPKSHD